MKAAIVYDRVNKWGGAERVLLSLHQIFPEAPLYTSVYNSESAPWAKAFPKVHTSFLQKIPYVRKNHELFAVFMPLAFESFSFDEYDLVISVTSEAAKGIVTKSSTFHLCYCLTPTRYLWSGLNDYFDTPFKRTISEPIINYLRCWDLVASQRPDAMIAISSEVKERIKKYYKRESKVIYPPVDLYRKNSLLRGPSAASRSFLLDTNQNYFLVVSRLVKYKRVDLAIAAFNDLEKRLIIVGSGREENKLKRMAKSNVTFIKNLTDKELGYYYENCEALVVPQREDFGLAIVEATGFGKPVIAFRGGGVVDIIKEGKTGIFFDKQSKESIIEAIRRFEKVKFDKDKISENARRFSKERFKKEFLKVIN